jgi:OOP family OmpA-OmpF porin
MGLNKPYNTMTPGYQTSNPSFYHIDLGTRYTINPHRYKGDIGYDKFTNKSNTKNLTATTYE